MIKRNKLSLFLLAVVMMLSIYYINMPEDEISSPVTSETVVTKYAQFAQMRIDILEQREELVVEFENVLASASTTDTDKNDAYLSMQQVLELTENEVLAETFIMDLGYLDCLVEYTNDLINVYILNYVYNYEDYEEVCIIVSNIFNSNTQVFIKPVSNN